MICRTLLLTALVAVGSLCIAPAQVPADPPPLGPPISWSPVTNGSATEAVEPPLGGHVPVDGPFPGAAVPLSQAEEFPAQLSNYYDPFGRQFAYGNAGVTPHQFGWYSYDDFVWLPWSDTSVGGRLKVVEWNSSFRYSRPIGENFIFSWTPAWNGKFWEGPTGIALPPGADQLSSQFKVAFVSAGPWTAEAAFTPQVSSDFQRSLNSNAYLFDGHAFATYRWSPEWAIVLGAAYWNRARDRVVPYAGVIWTPDDRWELRLLFPKSRLSRYLGQRRGFDVWAYGSAEFVVEAFQVDFDEPRTKDRLEFSDWRLLLGVNATKRNWSLFLEGGGIVDRRAAFRGSTPGFTIDDSFMLRVGLMH